MGEKVLGICWKKKEGQRGCRELIISSGEGTFINTDFESVFSQKGNGALAGHHYVILGGGRKWLQLKFRQRERKYERTSLF